MAFLGDERSVWSVKRRYVYNREKGDRGGRREWREERPFFMDRNE